MAEIDWSKRDGDPEDICHCRCKAVYNSHSFLDTDKGFETITRKPCPACRRNNDCWWIESAPERFIIGG